MARACNCWRKKFFAFLIPGSKSSLILTVSCPTRDRFLEAILLRTERKLAGPGRPGTVDGLVVGGALGGAAPNLGRARCLAARGGYVNPASKGCLTQHPWRLPPLHPLAQVARGTGKPRTHCAARTRARGCLKSESPPSCPGRDAALFALLRRTGTVANTGVRYGPGSAAHRSARATRCAASGARTTNRSGCRAATNVAWTQQ
jgi:hypothetical protein